MNYDDWLKSVPVEITGDALWKMAVYRQALFLGELAWFDVCKESLSLWRRCAFATRGALAARRTLAGSLAFGHPFFGYLRAFAEKELFHLLHQEILRPRISHVEAVVVDQNGGLTLPHFPSLLRDVFEDALSQFAWKRRPGQARQLAAELHAFDCSLCHNHLSVLNYTACSTPRQQGGHRT